MEGGEPTPTSAKAEEGGVEAKLQQLSQKVVHLEADVEILQRRNAELERENEELAAKAKRPDLEARLRDVLAENARLEAELEKRTEEGRRRLQWLDIDI